MKTITVKAAPREHHHGWWSARRFFPNGQAVVLEVLDDENDPADVEVDEKVNGMPTGEKRKVPDPRRIGQISLRQLMAQQDHLTVFEGGEIPVAPAAPDPSDLQRQIDELRAALSDANARLDETRRPARGGRRGAASDDGDAPPQE